MLALNNSTSCQSPPAMFVVEDRTRDPQFASVMLTTDKGCGDDASASAGAIMAAVLVPDVDNDNSPDYMDYTLSINTPDATSVSVFASSLSESFPPLQGIAEGDYTLTLSNNETLCSSDTDITLEKEEPIFRLSRIASSPQTLCDPNGSASILGIEYNEENLTQMAGQNSVFEPSSPAGDFTFVWEDEERTILTPTLEYQLEDVPSGEYVVAVTHVASECVAEATLFVENMSENPLVSVAEVQADQSCDPLLSNGIIMSSVDGGIDHTDPRYEFSWLEDVEGEPDPAGVILTSTATLDMANAGRYWVTVRNIDSNCLTSMPGNITAEPLVPRVRTTDIEYGASTVCSVNPFRLADGSARLTGVEPGDLADYNISFYDENPQNNLSALPLTTITNGNASFSELLHTTPYFVQLQHAGLGCLSEVYQLQVPDGTEAPLVAIDMVSPTTNCNPDNPNGVIEAQVRQNSTSPYEKNTRDYTWTWERLMPDPSTGIITGNETSASNLRAGVYRIIAERNATGCADTLEYSLQNVSQTPEVKVEVRGNSLCEAPYDGLAVASVINPLPDRNYNFIWLVNDGGPIPSRSESDVIVASVDTLRDNLEYRVIAYDQEDDFCRTHTPLVFSVPSLRRDPVINVEVVQLLTYCPLYTDNPLHFPNGVLRAVVPDDEDYEQSHDFSWSALGNPDEVISEGVFP